MSTSIKQLKFLHTWRPYQDKILSNFSKHIEDNHFHIVAPPGSGKTILGIEILKRIGKKTIVLAPTLTIRNQWKNRLQEFFTEDCDFKEFSFDIKKPADITFSTYQGLYSFYKTFDNKEDYFLFFTKNNIEVLLLDEAHHLKNEWWKCLFELKQQHLQTIIALTATPPYDSEISEIQKYFNLCGEIDDEILVPDLVKENNLCPHQDIVYFSKPENKEINTIVDFRLKIANFITDLLKDKEFINFIKQHRFYTKTEQNINEIYKFSTFFLQYLFF
ncbi:DEAD/DEAH box helicase [Tenacibaculum retecalamus]|uniref:DEAD/DEAH box helicase n=1 Tax=Tenacibaculum retecalamus TaxID=3018315 RepID=UPI0023D96553|nr:DEAD/DEAH box helicase family protein [Tenacibaculum retecalamus]WBX70304.1 DEAD/DEAH box helicase family protein [Tenacibaculum retecalamus]